ncbi:hypothetical protein WA026_001726 [Henosepilachna vigintioctopunctata]|uniref:Small nuclear ribonucleoprotein Sm D1 n=1 Tax=Henosepilachna vigintioctopunctata TaxID=420089 RepID=A0AAW1UU77_9CUCU
MRVRFLMKLSNEFLSMKLKKGSIIHGAKTGVDVAMNAHLKAVNAIVENRKPVNLDTLTVRRINIKYYILSDSLPLETLLMNYTPKAKAKKSDTARSASRGRGRGKEHGGPRGRGRGRGCR